MKFYCTFTRTLRDFVPLDPREIKMYCCGPTVYDYVHIGNLRAFLNAEFSCRVLRFLGHNVTQVMNITDVGHLVSDGDTGEDKMEKGARRTGKTAWDIAQFYTDAFITDIQALNFQMPTLMPKATDFIKEQIELVTQIETAGMAYATTDGIYFETTKLSNYGELAKLDLDGLRGGERVDLGDKKSKTDFALWKLSHPNEQRQMEWDSPWGKGFPGWHLECTAMSVKLLGKYFDIHWGGEDHIAVHHTNEIAQCQAAHGTRESNFWLHTKFLNFGKQKMAKSDGTFVRLQDIKDKDIPPIVFRYLCLGAHYRASMEFTWDNLRAAMVALERLYSAVTLLKENFSEKIQDAKILPHWNSEFISAISNDLGMPQAIAIVWRLIKNTDVDGADKLVTLLNWDKVLGLSLQDPHKFQLHQTIPESVLLLAQARLDARNQKNWAISDDLKRRISDAGYEILDTTTGYQLKKSDSV